MSSDLLGYLITAIPGILVTIALVVCLALAISKRDRLGPRAAGLAAAGLALLALNRLFSVAYIFLIQQLYDATRSVAIMNLVFLALDILGTIGLGLLIAAVFTRRPVAQAQVPY